MDIGCVIHSGTASYTIRIRIAPNHNEQDTARFVTVTQGAVVAGYYTGIGRRSYSVMARPSEFAALIDVRYALPLPATNVMYLQVGQDDNTLKGEFLGTGKPATEAHWRVELDPTLLHN